MYMDSFLQAQSQAQALVSRPEKDPRERPLKALPWTEFKAFLRKNLGDSRAFIDTIWSKVKRDSQYQQECRTLLTIRQPPASHTCRGHARTYDGYVPGSGVTAGDEVVQPACAETSASVTAIAEKEWIIVRSDES